MWSNLLSFFILLSRGVCKHCSNKLKPATLTADEFNKLRSSFISSVIVGENIFLKTNPKELEQFQEFLEKTAPYDFVLDGLNIAFAVGLKNHSTDIFARMVSESLITVN